MDFPSVEEIATELHRVSLDLDADDLGVNEFGEPGTCDVRLQVYPDGSWAIRVGSSDFDQDHRGYWGASSIAASESLDDCRTIAADLREQALDEMAEDPDAPDLFGDAEWLCLEDVRTAAELDDLDDLVTMLNRFTDAALSARDTCSSIGGGILGRIFARLYRLDGDTETAMEWEQASDRDFDRAATLIETAGIVR